MTVREAVELVLQASALGVGAPSAKAGTIYVLDMGEPVRIMDLARQMIRLAGLRPDKNIEIVVTGPRPGEKLREELFHEAVLLRSSGPRASTSGSDSVIAGPNHKKALRACKSFGNRESEHQRIQCVNRPECNRGKSPGACSIRSNRTERLKDPVHF